MPKIKRYFPVNHNINDDPEIWDMTRQFGDRSLRVWMELLSTGDRNDGYLPTMSQAYARALAGKCQVSASTVSKVWDHAHKYAWIVSDPIPRVRNYGKYHTTRDANGIPAGKQAPSPPNLPNHPNLPKEEKKKNKTPQPPLAIPPWLSQELWQEFKAMRIRTRKPLTPYAEKLALADLAKLKGHGEDPVAVVNQTILKSWQGFFPVKDNGSHPNETSQEQGKRIEKEMIEEGRLPKNFASRGRNDD